LTVKNKKFFLTVKRNKGEINEYLVLGDSMIDNTEFWKAGGQTGTRDQEFHARSQQEYPDVRIQLLEGMSEGEVVGEEVRLKYDRMARDAVLREELAMDPRVGPAMVQDRRVMDMKVIEMKSELKSLPPRQVNRNPFNVTTRAPTTTKAVRSVVKELTTITETTGFERYSDLVDKITFTLELANLAAGDTEESRMAAMAAVWFSLGADVCDQLQQGREPQRIINEGGNYQTLIQAACSLFTYKTPSTQAREAIEDTKHPPSRSKGVSVNAFLLRLKRLFQQYQKEKGAREWPSDVLAHFCRVFRAGVRNAEFEQRFEADKLIQYLMGDEAACGAYIRSLVENADPQGLSDMLGVPRAIGKQGGQSSCQIVESTVSNVAVVGDGTCFRCGSDKHLAKMCPMPDNRPPKPPGRRFEKACYGCGDKTHLIAQCPVRPNKGKIEGKNRKKTPPVKAVRAAAEAVSQMEGPAEPEEEWGWAGGVDVPRATRRVHQKTSKKRWVGTDQNYVAEQYIPTKISSVNEKKEGCPPHLRDVAVSIFFDLSEEPYQKSVHEIVSENRKDQALRVIVDSGQSTEFDLLLNLAQFKEKFPNQDIEPISAKCGTANDKSPLIIEAQTCMNGYLVFNQGKTEIKTLPRLSIGLSSALSPSMPLLGNKALKTHSLSVHFFPTATVLRAGGEGFMQLGRLNNSRQGSRRVHRRAPKAQTEKKGTFVEPSRELLVQRSSSGAQFSPRANKNHRNKGGKKGLAPSKSCKTSGKTIPSPQDMWLKGFGKKGGKVAIFRSAQRTVVPPRTCQRVSCYYPTPERTGDENRYMYSVVNTVDAQDTNLEGEEVIPLEGYQGVMPGVIPRQQGQQGLGGKLGIWFINETDKKKILGKHERVGLGFRVVSDSSENFLSFSPPVEQNDPKGKGGHCGGMNGRGGGGSETVSHPVDRSQQLWDELHLENNVILNQNSKVKTGARELIKEFSDIFATSLSPLGVCTINPPEVIKLKEGAVPRRQRPRPLTEDRKADLRQQLDTWLAEGVISPSKSPWASPLVPVRKKDGTIRWAVDYRLVNSQTISDAFPTPIIGDTLENLAGSHVFSSLDTASAYHHLRVAPESRNLTAFCCHFGLFHFNRLPFGLKQAGACYCRTMQDLVDFVDDKGVLAYLDDVLGHSATAEQHLGVLRKIFLAHRKFGLKLKTKKTHLFQDKVVYLGFLVSGEGISVDDELVKKIKDWKEPTNPKELATFVGFAGFYREFIPDFASLTSEMMRLKGKKTWLTADKDEWTKVCAPKFNQLIQQFLVPPLRGYPMSPADPRAGPFVVTTDWSKVAIGATLHQYQDNVLRFIGAAGRKCAPHEQNYPSCNANLTSCKDPGGTRRRWLEFLSRFEIQVFHVKGKLLTNADCLSRRVDLPPPTQSDIEDTKDRETVYELPVKFTQAVELRPVNSGKNASPPTVRASESLLLPNFSPGAVLPVRGPGIVVEGGRNDNKICLDRLREAQAQDEVCQDVITWFDSRTGNRKSDRELKAVWAGRGEEEAELHSEREAFRQVRGNLILTKPPPAAGTTSSGKLLAFQELLGDRIRVRYIVPHIFRQQVIDKSHTRGHRGRQRTIEAIKSGFYWPSLEVDVNTFINRCMGCLVRNKPNLKVGIHRPVERFSVGETVCLDMLGPFPESSSGNKLVLSILDLGSRYAKLVPLKDKKAATVLTAFKKEWLQGEGSLPSQVLCDQGKEFASGFAHQFWRDFDIRVKFAHPGNHQTLPVERLHRTIMSMVRSIRVDGERDWEEAISIATSLYNTSVHSSTGCSPNLLYYGREKPLPGFNLLHDYNQGLGEGEPTLLAQRQADLMNRIIAISGQETTRMFKANARAYGGRSNRYSPGDVVFAWTEGPRLGGDHIPSRKLRVKWSGPFVVVERLNENMVMLGELTDRSNRVRDPQHPGKLFPSHFSRLVLHRTAAEVMAGNQIHPLIKLPNLNLEGREELESAASSWEAIVPFQFFPQILDEILPEESELSSESDLEGRGGESQIPSAPVTIPLAPLNSDLEGRGGGEPDPVRTVYHPPNDPK
jgi:hypothetical protein